MRASPVDSISSADRNQLPVQSTYPSLSYCDSTSKLNGFSIHGLVIVLCLFLFAFFCLFDSFSCVYHFYNLFVVVLHLLFGLNLHNRYLVWLTCSAHNLTTWNVVFGCFFFFSLIPTCNYKQFFCLDVIYFFLLEFSNVVSSKGKKKMLCQLTFPVHSFFCPQYFGLQEWQEVVIFFSLLRKQATYRHMLYCSAAVCPGP